jgi:hypothetical protein
MESSKDTIVLDYDDNEELKATLGGKEPGDKVTLTVTALVKANDEKTFEAIIEEVTAEDTPEEEEEESEDDEEEAESEDDEATPSVVRVMTKKKKTVDADAEE